MSARLLELLVAGVGGVPAARGRAPSASRASAAAADQLFDLIPTLIMHRFHEGACSPDADSHMSVTYQRAGLQRPTGRRTPGGRARPLNSRLGRTRAWHHGAPGWQHSASCRRRTLRRTPYWPASRSWRTAPRGPSHGQAGCTICTPHRLPLLMRQTPHAQLSMQGRVRRARQGLWKVTSTQGVRARSTAARSRASQRACAAARSSMRPSAYGPSPGPGSATGPRAEPPAAACGARAAHQPWASRTCPGREGLTTPPCMPLHAHDTAGGRRSQTRPWCGRLFPAQRGLPMRTFRQRMGGHTQEVGQGNLKLSVDRVRVWAAPGRCQECNRGSWTGRCCARAPSGWSRRRGWATRWPCAASARRVEPHGCPWYPHPNLSSSCSMHSALCALRSALCLHEAHDLPRVTPWQRAEPAAHCAEPWSAPAARPAACSARAGRAGQRARSERKALPSACCSSSWLPVPPFMGHCAALQQVGGRPGRGLGTLRGHLGGPAGPRSCCCGRPQQPAESSSDP